MRTQNQVYSIQESAEEKISIWTVVAILALVIGIAGHATEASAREFSLGNGTTKSSKSSGHSWGKEATTPKGSFSKSGSGSFNKETKSYDREVTGYKGNERSSSTSFDKDNKTVTTQSTTGASKTTSYSDGQKSSTYYGPNGQTGGKTSSYDKDSQTVTKAYQNGSTVTGSYSDGQKTTIYNGTKGYEGSATTSYDKEGKTATTQTMRGGSVTTQILPNGEAVKVYTTPNGKTYQVKTKYNP